MRELGQERYDPGWNSLNTTLRLSVEILANDPAFYSKPYGGRWVEIYCGLINHSNKLKLFHLILVTMLYFTYLSNISFVNAGTDVDQFLLYVPCNFCFVCSKNQTFETYSLYIELILDSSLDYLGIIIIWTITVLSLFFVFTFIWSLLKDASSGLNIQRIEEFILTFPSFAFTISW